MRVSAGGWTRMSETAVDKISFATRITPLTTTDDDERENRSIGHVNM